MQDPANPQTEEEAINFFNANSKDIYIRDIFEKRTSRGFFSNTEYPSVIDLIKEHKLYNLLLSIIKNPTRFEKENIYRDESNYRQYDPHRIIEFVIKFIVESVNTHEYSTNYELFNMLLTEIIPYTLKHDVLPTLLIKLFLDPIIETVKEGDDLFFIIKLIVDKIRQHFIDDDISYENYLYKVSTKSTLYSYSDYYYDDYIKYHNYDAIMIALQLDLDTSAEDGLLKGIKYILGQHNKSINYYNNDSGSRIHTIVGLNNLWNRKKYGSDGYYWLFDKQLARRIFERFIALGGDINFVAKDGTTALDLAIKNKNTEVINLLKYFGAKSNSANIKPALPFIPRRNNKSRSRISSFMPNLPSSKSVSNAEGEYATANSMPMLNRMTSQLPSLATESSTKILSNSSNTFPNLRLNRPRIKKSFGPMLTRRGGKRHRSTRRRK